MLNADFDIEEDIIGLTELRHNLKQIVADVEENGSQKIIIRNGKPSVMVISVPEFKAMQDRILAMELEEGYRLALEEEKRGELIEFADLAAEFDIDISELTTPTKPEGYEAMIPARVKAKHANGKK